MRLGGQCMTEASGVGPWLDWLYERQGPVRRIFQGEPRNCRGWRTALRGSTALVGASLALATASQAQTGPFLYVPDQNGGVVSVFDTSTNLPAGGPIPTGV